MSAKVDNFYAHCALFLLFTYLLRAVITVYLSYTRCYYCLPIFYALLLLFTYVMGNF